MGGQAKAPWRDMNIVAKKEHKVKEVFGDNSFTFRARSIRSSSASGERETQAGLTSLYSLPTQNSLLRVRINSRRSSRITATSAKLDGRLNPLGEPAQFHFEYGLDATYGMKTPPASAGQQISGRLVFAAVAGLAPKRTYHYRLLGSNKSGTTHGADMTFQTGAE